jgi:hypothetical protein
MKHLGLATLLLMLTACDGCSERERVNTQVEQDLDRILSRQFAPSLDAGLTQLAELEARLAPRLGVDDAALKEWAGLPTPTITHDELKTVVSLADVAQLRRLLPRVLEREVTVYGARWTERSIELELLRNDPELVRPEAYPPLLPAGSGGLCWSECRAQERRIVEKRALLTEFSERHHRLRQLRRADEAHRDEVNDQPTAGLRALLERVLDLPPPPGASVSLTRDRLRLCGARLDLAACERLGAKCTSQPACAPECASRAPELGPCGFTLEVNSP